MPEDDTEYASLTFPFHLPGEQWMLKRVTDQLEKNPDREYQVRRSGDWAEVWVKPVAPMEGDKDDV